MNRMCDILISMSLVQLYDFYFYSYFSLKELFEPINTHFIPI